MTRSVLFCSVIDLQAVSGLGKVNGNFGRIAGLLECWLGEKRGRGASPREIEAVMTNFQMPQAQALISMVWVVKIYNSSCRKMH